MKREGGCHCGAVRYEVSGDPERVSLCHCRDCRKSSGAPVVAWAVFAEAKFRLVRGAVTTFNSSGQSMRSFCSACGTGLFFRNAEFLPGVVDIQGATLDDPDAMAPTNHVQVAERIGWMKDAHRLPTFERYPG